MSTGLCIALHQTRPTILEFNGKIVELYHYVTPCGQKRCRIVADREVKITGPHRIKKSLTANLIVNHPELVNETQE